MLICTGFHSFAITYLKLLASKISFSNKGCASFFANTKRTRNKFWWKVLEDLEGVL